MSVDLEGSACDSEAARLLPWFVNGTVSAADGERVARHLEHCQICRSDLDHERALRAALKDGGAVEYAPQAGLARTLARIDELTRETPAAAEAARARAARPARRRITATQWLTAAVVVQAIGIGLLGSSLLARQPGDRAAPGYETLSSATPVASGPRIRAVFTPAMKIGELRMLLGAQRLVVVAGPSEAGVFTLGSLGPAADRGRLEAMLTGLRANPGVLFAEPASDDAAARP